MRENGTWFATVTAIGFAAALSAEVAASVLLYDESGFFRAATVVLAVQAGAFGVGLLSVGTWATRGGPSLERARGWWFLAMVTFSLTTAFTGAWTLALGTVSRATQALGLVLLAALPMFATGGLLGAVIGGAVTEADRFDEESRVRLKSGALPMSSALAASAWLGAAVGVAVGGVVLPRVPPFSLLLLCMVVLASGALLHGRALERRPFVETLERAEGPPGVTLRAERWTVARNSAYRLAVVREQRHVVSWDPRAVSPQGWQAVLDAVLLDLGHLRRPGRVLLLGAESAVLLPGAESEVAVPVSLRAGEPEIEITLVESDVEYLRLVRAHRSGAGGTRHPLKVVPSADPRLGEFDVIVVGAGRGGVEFAPAAETLGELARPDSATLILGASHPPAGLAGRWSWWSYEPTATAAPPFAALGERGPSPLLLGVLDGPEHWVRAPELEGFTRSEVTPPLSE